MSTSPTPLAHLAALQPYRAAKAFAVRHNLSANEACLGPSPMALSAAHSAAGELARYPDGSAEALRQAIGRRCGMPMRTASSAPPDPRSSSRCSCRPLLLLATKFCSASALCGVAA